MKDLYNLTVGTKVLVPTNKVWAAGIITKVFPYNPRAASCYHVDIIDIQVPWHTKIVVSPEWIKLAMDDPNDILKELL